MKVFRVRVRDLLGPDEMGIILRKIDVTPDSRLYGKKCYIEERFLRVQGHSEG